MRGLREKVKTKVAAVKCVQSARPQSPGGTVWNGEMLWECWQLEGCPARWLSARVDGKLQRVGFIHATHLGALVGQVTRLIFSSRIVR